MLGIAQQSKKAAYASARQEDSVLSPPMYYERVYLRKVLIYSMDLGPRVLDLR